MRVQVFHESILYVEFVRSTLSAQSLKHCLLLLRRSAAVLLQQIKYDVGDMSTAVVARSSKKD